MKTTSRRNFLRGLGGAALALPWMESISTAALDSTGTVGPLFAES